MALNEVIDTQQTFDDEEYLRRANILKTLIRVLAAITLLMSLDLFFTDVPVAVSAVIALALTIELITWLLLRKGKTNVGSVVLVGGLWLLLVGGMFVADMRGNVPWILLIVIVLIAGLLLGSRAGFIVAGMTTLAGLAYYLVTVNKLSPLDTALLYNPIAVLIAFSAVSLAGAGLVRLTNSSVETALAKARQYTLEQIAVNRKLETIQETLEQQVEQRTMDLQARTRYLQAAIDVSRATSSILETYQLIQSSVDLIRAQFDLYYVGLFLVEAGDEWAVLQAGTGNAGQLMVARGHRIRIGSGMVGWSIANSQPRIALDVGQDAVRLVTTELPDTRSEAAIPLRSRGKVLGALTVQSNQPAAFGEMEIAVFQALADQLAIALENARLLQESQQALEEARRTQGQISRRAWNEFMTASNFHNVKYSFGQVETQSETGSLALRAAHRQVLATGQPLQVKLAGNGASNGANQHSTLLMPVAVRDQIVGVIRFSKEPSAGNLASTTPDWKPDEIELLEAVTGQLGIALDSARLYQDVQQHAYREQLSGEMTARIRQTLDIQAVLRTAVEEIQRSMNLPEVMISLTPPEE